MEIKKEDWNFILNSEDPDLVEKFEQLIGRYVENAYNNPEQFPNRRAVGYIREWSKQDNWLCKMELDNFKVLQIGLDNTRAKTFLHHAEAIGMMRDYSRFFGESTEAVKPFVNAYNKMLEKHKRGFEEEQRTKREKAKNSPFGKILGTLTGATTRRGFVSGINARGKEEDNGDQDYGE